MPLDSVENSYVLKAVPDDDRIAEMRTLADLPALSGDTWKGGVLKQALPTDLRKELLSCDDKALAVMSRQECPIDPLTGTVHFGYDLEQYLSKDARSLINSVAARFNHFSGAGSSFCLVRSPQNLDLEFPRFHFDSKTRHLQQIFRTAIFVSNNEQDHETEYLVSKNVSSNRIQQIIAAAGTTHADDLPDDVREHIRHIEQGDLFAFKGLSRDKTDWALDGLAHRSPARRATYPGRDSRRIGLIWTRDFNEYGCEND